MINTASSLPLEAPPTPPPSTSLQCFWGQWTQTLWEQETPFMGHLT